MSKLILSLLFLSMLSLVSAETFPQNGDVLVSHPIRIGGGVDSGIVANITMSNPLGQVIIPNQAMAFNSSTIEHEYLVTGGNTSLIGIYPYCITSAKSGLNQTVCYDDVEITASGFPRINSGEGMITIAGLIIIFGLGILSFVLFLNAENPLVRLTLVCTGGIFLLMSVLSLGIITYQNLGGFANIISGYDVLVFVVYAIIVVAILAFFVVIFLMMLKAWRIRKGGND